MSKKAIIPEVGFEVETPKGKGVVKEKNAGWYAVEVDGEVYKFRASDLKCWAVETTIDNVVVPDKEDDEEEGPHGTRIRANLENYEPVKAASGNRSYDIADSVAEMFRGCDLEEVYKRAARDLKANGETAVTIKSLKERYENLNPGHQRMCVGNRVRAARARAAEAEPVKDEK